MFRTMPLPTSEQRRVVEIFVEGRSVRAREGDTLATALLNAEVVPFRRTPVSGQRSRRGSTSMRTSSASPRRATRT